MEWLTTDLLINANTVIIIFLGLVSLLASVVHRVLPSSPPPIPTAVVMASASPTPFPSPIPRQIATLSPKPTPSPSSMPTNVTLTVPFLVQAPHANWDALHEDACEEASLINVVHFLQNKPVQSRDDGEPEIQALVHYETEHGLGPSITLQQLADVARDYYHLTGRVVKNPTVTTIKSELTLGHPVIVGAAGKVLPNPYYKNGGPNYHMLVIKGFDDRRAVDPAKCRQIDAASCHGQGVFITNDVGIWQGDGFIYTYNGLGNAIHDWDATNILNGQKAYLVFD